MAQDFRITAKTFYGLEEVLAEEIRNLGGSNVKALNRAVEYNGDLEIVYRSNFELRTAISILVKLEGFKIRDEKDLYNKTKRINWGSVFRNEKTFAVKGAVNSDLFRHSQYPFLVVKDAIVDHFKEKNQDRPNVDKRTPHIVIDLYIRENNVVISLNTSGAPLFQRGYRTNPSEAPINEVLAAGMIKLSGWNPETPLVDFFCGSGTIPIEAALMAHEIPPQINRSQFAFKHLIAFDEKLWRNIQLDANQRPKKGIAPIVGVDVDDQMILASRRNAGNLPLGKSVEFFARDFADHKKTSETGLIISNPPYDLRLEADVEQMYGDIGAHLKHEFSGFSCWIIAPEKDALMNIGLKPSKKINLYNGKISCTYSRFDMYAGSKKKAKS